MITSRTLSMPVCVAASISSTSMSRPCAISWHASQVPQGSAVGPSSQLSARASRRAVVVLPTPRGPAKTNAWWMRPLVSALRSVCVTACCPTTSSKRCGRHLRARTVYMTWSRTSRLRMKADADPTAAREGLRHMSVTT